MIRANELRVGNWVYRTEGFKTFKTKVSGNTIACAGSDGEIDFISPIPLTPEILQKAGFERFTNSDFIKGEVNLWIGNNNINFSINAYYHTSIKHLHQLQNFYYALTGEELEINL